MIRLKIRQLFFVFSMAPVVGATVAKNMNQQGDASNFVNPFDSIPDEQLSSIFDHFSTLVGNGFKKKFAEFDNNGRRRHLEDTAGAYPCGHVYGKITLEELQEMADLLIEGLFPIEGPAGAFNGPAKIIMKDSLQYDLEARKICTSCEEVATLYADYDFVKQDSEGIASFQSYCGEDTNDYTSTFSGLMIIPVETGTDDYVIGKLKAYIQMHVLAFYDIDYFAPTNLYPDLGSVLDDIAASDATITEKGLDFYSEYYDLIAPFISAGAGAVTFVPDGPGYGESPNERRSIFVKTKYQASAVPLYLYGKDWLAKNGGGCAILSDAVTLGGFSEGGYASIAIAAAIDEVGATIVGVNTGSPASKLSSEQAFYMIDQIDTGKFPLQEFGWPQFISGLLGYSYSSTNTDLVNTGTGQDLLSEDWIDSVTNVMINDFSSFEFAAFYPAEDPLVMMNPDFVTMMRIAVVDGERDACGTMAKEGSTDKLCEAMQSNDLIDILETATYPVSICHSPEDDAISYGNLPDNIDQLDNVSLFNLLPVQGDHFESSSTCLIAMMLPMSSFGDYVSSKIDDLDEPGACSRIPSPTDPPSIPPPSTPEPTPSPTDSPTTPEPTPSPTLDNSSSSSSIDLGILASSWVASLFVALLW